MAIFRATLRSQARDIVLEQILDGDLEPGEALNISQLAQNLGISRTPLREALLRLSEEGLVGTNETNTGFFVWPLSLKEAEELGQIHRALECLAIETTDNASEGQIRRMRAANSRLREAYGDPKEMMKWDDQWHEALVSGSRNEQLLEMIETVRNRFYRYRWYGYDYVMLHRSDEKLTSLDQHARITDALERGQRSAVKRLIHLHWSRGLELLATWLPESGDFPPE